MILVTVIQMSTEQVLKLQIKCTKPYQFKVVGQVFKDVFFLKKKITRCYVRFLSTDKNSIMRTKLSGHVRFRQKPFSNVLKAMHSNTLDL